MSEEERLRIDPPASEIETERSSRFCKPPEPKAICEQRLMSAHTLTHTHHTVWGRQMDGDRQINQAGRGGGDSQHPLTGLLLLDCNLYNPDVSCRRWQDAMHCNAGQTNLLSHQGAAQPPTGCNGLVLLITWGNTVANGHMAHLNAAVMWVPLET